VKRILNIIFYHRNLTKLLKDNMVGGDKMDTNTYYHI